MNEDEKTAVERQMLNTIAYAAELGRAMGTWSAEESDVIDTFVNGMIEGYNAAYPQTTISEGPVNGL